MKDSIQFYNNNAKLYVDSIENANISDQLQRFLQLFPNGGKILDGGCGTGRDSLYMIKQGYDVVAFDASEKMAEIASVIIGINVGVNTFEDVELPNEYFDGIWCMSSLLHVSRSNMLSVINKLYQSLKFDGYFYCTYKLRSHDFSEGDRHFTCYNEQSFRELIAHTKFQIENISELPDSRPNRDEEKWLCVLLKKQDMQ